MLFTVGMLFSSMVEFRMCFKTYAFKKIFDAKSQWSNKKIYARHKCIDGKAKHCKRYISTRHQPDYWKAKY
jgi:hypothetical protein